MNVGEQEVYCMRGSDLRRVELDQTLARATRPHSGSYWDYSCCVVHILNREQTSTAYIPLIILFAILNVER